MNLLQRFEEFIRRENLFHSKDKLLLAISGGVDSVVLCELCRQAGYDFSIVHCNFKLRGEESERDERFVRDLGKKYGVEVLVKKFDTEKYAEESKKGIQEAARDLRYAWFKEMVDRWPMTNDSDQTATRHPSSAIFVLTAHHANDNIETALINFCRGTGLNGLEGIPLAHLYIRRPLLGLWKEELIEFAKQNRLEHVEDSSNLSSKYTRNLFRNEVIPAIKKVYPQAEENILDNIGRFKNINALYSLLVGELKKKLCKVNGTEIRIPVKELMRYQGTSFIYEFIKDFGFGEKQVEEVIKLASAGSGKYIENETYQLIKHRNWFIIAPRHVRTETIMIEKDMTSIRSQAGMINLKFDTCEKFLPDKSERIAQLDAGEIEFPLLFRRWKQGDYFYPLGIRKKKKLSRFLIDQKLPKNQKENVYVLESAKKIIWVVGFRIDDRFKVTDKTKTVLKLSFTPNE